MALTFYYRHLKVLPEFRVVKFGWKELIQRKTRYF